MVGETEEELSFILHPFGSGFMHLHVDQDTSKSDKNKKAATGPHDQSTSAENGNFTSDSESSSSGKQEQWEEMSLPCEKNPLCESAATQSVTTCDTNDPTQIRQGKDKPFSIVHSNF